MIYQAICTKQDRKITLAHIYEFMSTRYPYFKTQDPSSWQNSVRHNLSLNKAFVRIQRGYDKPGKGAFWAIDPASVYLFKSGVYKRRSRGSASSGGGDRKAAARARARSATSTGTVSDSGESS